LSEHLAEIRCFKCQTLVAPTETSCPACHQPLGRNDGSTRLESMPAQQPRTAPVMDRPDPDALPSWRRKVVVPIAAVTLVAIIILIRAGRLDRAEQITAWTNEVTRELRNSRSDYRLQPDDQKPHGGAVLYVGDAKDLPWFQAVPLPPRFNAIGTPTRYSFFERKPERGDYYIVTILGGRPLSFSVTYIVDFSGRQLRAFDYGKQSLLTSAWAKWSILALLIIVPAADRWSVSSHRRKRMRAYEAYERERTAVVYRAREYVQQARILIEASDLAKALVAVGEALDLLPEYGEAIELKRLIRTLAAEQASVVVVDFAPPSPDVDQVLYLRVVGTPYAYRARPGAATIRVGRQRPKTGEGASAENDLVIRIPASDDRTLRISRHHFEINRIGQEYFVVDHSNGQTLLNGRPLAPAQPAKVVSGDRLLIADVMTLEVSIRSGTPQSGARIVQLGADAARFNLEATVGDMLTEV
jgi:hypothetical protein